MKKLNLFLILLIPFFKCFAQVETNHSTDQNLFENHKNDIIDASYKGGINNFYTFISNNFNFNNLKKEDILSEYKEKDIMVIYIHFSINEEGKPVDFQPINTESTNSFYLEGVRVISSTKWTAATKNGKPFIQDFNIPIQAYIRDFR